MKAFRIEGNIVDIIQKKIYSGSIEVAGKKIMSIIPVDDPTSDTYILPGFIDAHVHIESSMLIPTEFARIAVPAAQLPAQRSCPDWRPAVGW